MAPTVNGLAVEVELAGTTELADEVGPAGATELAVVVVTPPGACRFDELQAATSIKAATAVPQR